MKKKKSRAAATVVAAAFAAVVPWANAEQAVEKGERIEITGSRLATSSDAESASPVAVIRAEDIRMEGFQSLELVLNNYPQFAGDQGNRISNSASGTATVNLRALGAQRTLVLLNGRRLPAGSPFALSPDLNQIPTPLIQRVEVLTGGASAVYGSDAIAGVVNFILNDRFEGIQGDVSYGFYNHQQNNGLAQQLLQDRGIPIPGDKGMDGGSGNASLVMGGNFAQDRGNAVVAFRYFKADALLQSERDYSACSIGRRGRTTQLACGGSLVGNPGYFVDLGFFRGDPEFQQADLRELTIDRPSGRVRDFRQPGDLYNFAPLNYYQRPQERYGFNAMANYEVSPNARVYGEFGYHDDRTVAQIAASAAFFVPALVRWENPLLTDDWRSNLVFRDANGNIATGPGTVANMEISRRNTEGGGRQDDLRHTSFREVLGVKGAVGHWDYDLFFQTARVNYQEKYSHDFSISRAMRALDVVVDPATGAPVCVSRLNGTDRNCVPYNVWALDAVSPQARAYLEVPAFQRAVTSQDVIGATVSANLGDFGIRLPRTKGAIEVALGFERRTEKVDFEADLQFEDLSGIGQPIRPVKGGFAVNELFGEIRAPILDVASVNASYRWSDYDTGVRTNTFGLGVTAAPSKTVKLRGSFQRAVRAPNVNELFAPQFNGGYFIAEGDPCAGPAPERPLADCQRTGVTPSRYGHIINTPTGDFPATVGGNPRLAPETASTYTAGLVFTPLRDLSATIDYFDIRIENTISEMDGAAILEQCLDTGNPFFCGLITRDPATQALWFGGANVIAINQNIGKTRVAGADLAVNYRLRLAAGHNVAFDMLGTWLRKQSIQIFPDAPSVACEGQFGSDCAGVPLPRWRHRLRATWQPPWNFEAAATWRYIGKTRVNPIFELPTLYQQLPPMSYLDLAAAWNVTKRITVRGGVNNVTDRDPPLSPGFTFLVNGNAFAQLYDVLGRHVFASVTVRF